MAKSQKAPLAPPRVTSVKDPERPTPAGAKSDDPIVLDDLPELIPITVRELDTIQIYLGDLIDHLISGTVPEAVTKPISTPKPGKPARAARARS
ncbi:hypothetical protein ABIF93_005819 [Bradyrhizobium japonicum]